MSDATMFSAEEPKMYYFVRETCGNRDQFATDGQGFKHIQFDVII